MNIIYVVCQQFLVAPLTPKNGGSEYPMFVFCEGKSTDALPPTVQYAPLDMNYTHYDSNIDVDDLESEEFEIL